MAPPQCCQSVSEVLVVVECRTALSKSMQQPGFSLGGSIFGRHPGRLPPFSGKDIRDPAENVPTARNYLARLRQDIVCSARISRWVPARLGAW